MTPPQTNLSSKLPSTSCKVITGSTQPGKAAPEATPQRMLQTEPIGPTLAEILSALSHALDLTEGQPQGHAVRTALLATRIAREMRLPDVDQARLFYGSLLKDTGCTMNSTRIQRVFGGDELVAKRDVKYVDWSNMLKATMFGISHAEKGGTFTQRLKKILQMAKQPTGVMDEVTQVRCARGAEISRQLGFDELTAGAIASLDEHWDGKGSPYHLSGQEIPILARVLSLAQTLELFASGFDVETAYQMVRRRTGKWFDPDVASAALSFERDTSFWGEHAGLKISPNPTLESPSHAHAATDADIDQVCNAFASIVDAKSHFTAAHSTRVTRYSVLLGEYMGLDEDRLNTLRRAALLHDIGKMGVSNAILDKPAKLTDEEWKKMRDHPRYSYEILSHIRGFDRIAAIAGAHHERLDGKGYWRGLTAAELDLDMRIVATADVYDAVSAERPYRGALEPEHVFAILQEAAGPSLDPACVAALKELHARDTLEV